MKRPKIVIFFVFVQIMEKTVKLQKQGRPTTELIATGETLQEEGKGVPLISLPLIYKKPKFKIFFNPKIYIAKFGPLERAFLA